MKTGRENMYLKILAAVDVEGISKRAYDFPKIFSYNCRLFVGATCDW